MSGTNGGGGTLGAGNNSLWRGMKMGNTKHMVHYGRGKECYKKKKVTSNLSGNKPKPNCSQIDFEGNKENH